VRRSNLERPLSELGQKLLLPQCKSNGRFTSVSGHKGRRSWMMRALRILDSPLCADSVSFATFRIICCPFLVFGAGAKPGAVE
jgi:hypothetical protein